MDTFLLIKTPKTTLDYVVVIFAIAISQRFLTIMYEGMERDEETLQALGRPRGKILLSKAWTLTWTIIVALLIVHFLLYIYARTSGSCLSDYVC